MKKENIERAIKEGKLPYKVTKNDEVRYTLSSSLEQCQTKFIGWTVELISLEEFRKNKEE
jgi:hypothetical protein